MEKYPYTNLQNVNLDWILEVVADFQSKYTDFGQSVEDALQAITDAKDQSLETLANALGAATTTIENAKLAAINDLQTEKASILNVMDQTLQTAITAVETAQEAAVADVGAEKDLGLSALRNQETLSIAAINTAYNQGVTRLQNLIATFPLDDAEIIGQLQIINSILNGTDALTVQWQQGTYEGVSPYDWTATPNTVSSVRQAGCSGRKLHVKANTTGHLITYIYYWTGNLQAIVSNPIGTTETTFIFPSTATYFSVLLGTDPNMTTPINLADVTATAEWVTRLDSMDDSTYLHLYSNDYNATNPTITWLDGKTLAENGHTANNAQFVTSNFIPCADMVNVEIATSTNELYPNVYICRYSDADENTLIGARERLLNTRSAFLGGAKYFRIAIKTTLANAQANISYHLFGTQRYKGKLYALGDSITQGTWNDGTNSGGNYSQCYIQTFADLKGYKLSNLGDHNSGLLSKGTNTQQSLKGFVDNNNFTDADMIIIAYGVNDYINNRVLGTPNDAVDANTCAGQLKYALSTLMGNGTGGTGKAPKAKIVILLPLNGNRVYSSNISTPTFADNWFFGAPNLTQNKTLEDYRQMIKTVGEYYGAQVIDFNEIAPINRGNLLDLLGDGLHPTKECHVKLGVALAGCLG